MNNFYDIKFSTWYKEFSNRSICRADRIQTATKTSSLGGPGNNGNEILHSLLSWSLTIRSSLLSYPGQSLLINTHTHTHTHTHTYIYTGG